MRILFIIEKINGYHNARLRALRQLCESRGHKFDVLEVFENSELYLHEDTIASFKSEFPQSVTSLSLQRKTADLRIARSIANAINTSKPDATIQLGFYQRYSILLLFMQRFQRHKPARFFCSESKADDHARVWFKELVKKQLTKSFEGALVGGLRHKEYWQRLGISKDRIATGYDVVDNSRYASYPAARTKTILCVARLVDRKRVDVLLRAFHKSNVRDYRLAIAGDGPLRASLEQLAQSLGIAERVDFLGSVPSGQMPDVYSSAQFLVLPSEWDQWGLAVNEAFASGIPAIVTETCGCAHEIVVDGSTGLIVPVNSVDKLAEAITQLCTNDQLRQNFGENALAMIRRYSPETFAENLINLIERNSKQRAV